MSRRREVDDMSVHDAASKGYSAAADTYVAGRPDYPAETGDWLRDVVGLGAGRSVLDLGSGTGKFLPYLRQTGARLLALEPVAAMRDKLVQENRDVEIVPGIASDIGLPDGAVDAVVCAQAFHWFATAEAIAEIRRVLVPGGVLGLIWNVRDERMPWVAALTALIDVHEAGAPRYRTGAWRRMFPAEGFAFLGEDHAPNQHVGSPERVILDRTLSVSFIAALPQDQQAELAGRVRALIAATPELAGCPTVAFPYETAMFAYRRL
jgi:SAM-dependent methyltransferase